MGPGGKQQDGEGVGGMLDPDSANAPVAPALGEILLEHSQKCISLKHEDLQLLMLMNTEKKQQFAGKLRFW